MQQMTPSACSGGNETGKQLIDIRDGKSYWVAKLKDGNCWMTQNLDLDLKSNQKLTIDDTDLLADWTPPYSTQTTTPGFLTESNYVQSFDPGNKYCDTSDCNLTTSATNNHDHQGNYYSWGAATAGQAELLTSTSAGQQSTQSICPRGWRLPPKGGNGSYATLLNGLTTSPAIIVVPYYFVSGGLVSNSSLGGIGSGGYYWSSTASNATNAYDLEFVSSGVYPSRNSTRYTGYSVRCVAR